MAELLYKGLRLLVLFYQIDDILHDYPAGKNININK
jgi:hypothetical protein